MTIPWDLEGTPLQIKTDSVLGSGEKMRVNVYDKNGTFITGVGMRFSSTIQFAISHCTTGWTDLPEQPQADVDKIWTITKTETSIIISCYSVDVLNYQFADSSDSDCVAKWGGNVVDQIMFKDDDTASDFYNGDQGKN